MLFDVRLWHRRYTRIRCLFNIQSYVAWLAGNIISVWLGDLELLVQRSGRVWYVFFGVCTFSNGHENLTLLLVVDRDCWLKSFQYICLLINISRILWLRWPDQRECLACSYRNQYIWLHFRCNAWMILTLLTLAPTWHVTEWVSVCVCARLLTHGRRRRYSPVHSLLFFFITYFFCTSCVLQFFMGLMAHAAISFSSIFMRFRS